MSVSAVLICYNEEELILNCLRWLNSLLNLDEICVVDSFSKDNTWQIISEFKTDKKFIARQQEFKSFGDQKNFCMDLATSEWILLIDADETYGHQMDLLLGDIKNKKLEKYNAFRFMTYVTFPDNRHYIHPQFLPFGFDPHVRLWRNSLARYKGDCHERLYDKNGRDLHECNDIDIMTLRFSLKEYKIIMLHHQLLKSRDALLAKGNRWSELDMIRKSAEQKIQVDKETWVRLQKGARLNEYFVAMHLAKEYWDFKE